MTLARVCATINTLLAAYSLGMALISQDQRWAWVAVGAMNIWFAVSTWRHVAHTARVQRLLADYEQRRSLREARSYYRGR